MTRAAEIRPERIAASMCSSLNSASAAALTDSGEFQSIAAHRLTTSDKKSSKLGGCRNNLLTALRNAMCVSVWWSKLKRSGAVFRLARIAAHAQRAKLCRSTMNTDLPAMLMLDTAVFDLMGSKRQLLSE